MTTHPATRAMVEEYVAWYDRHLDPAWQDVVLTPPDASGARAPVGYRRCRGAPDDLRAMGRCFSATTFLSAGNITHTPAYGNLIALGMLTRSRQRNVSPEQIANAEAYREMIARTGRFLTFCRRRGDDRLPAARGPGRARGAQHRARDRRGPRDARQGRHAHEPGLRRGRLYRRHVRRRHRRPPGDLRRAGECAAASR